jgi:hypothetical protein
MLADLGRAPTAGEVASVRSRDVPRGPRGPAPAARRPRAVLGSRTGEIRANWWGDVPAASIVQDSSLAGTRALMRRWRACLLGAAVLAGCGGGSASRPAGSDRDQIAQTVHAYLRALADSDASGACGELTALAQRDLATMAGRGSCEDGARAVSRAVGDSDRRGLRSAKVFGQRIQGAKATAKVTGEHNAPRQLPLVKQGGRWKIAGFEGDLHFRSRADAACISGGLHNYDAHKVPRFWYREGRDDFRDYIVTVCRRAERRGLTSGPGKADRAQVLALARQVIREMTRSGQIHPPG